MKLRAVSVGSGKNLSKSDKHVSSVSERRSLTKSKSSSASNLDASGSISAQSNSINVEISLKRKLKISTAVILSDFICYLVLIFSQERGKNSTHLGFYLQLLESQRQQISIGCKE